MSAGVLLVAMLGMRCTPNTKPALPLDVNWPASVLPGESVVLGALLVDSDGDSVACRFVWSTGDTSAWTAFVRSGDTAVASHSWPHAGLQSVRMQAQDRRGALSGWAQDWVSVGERHPVLWSMERSGTEYGFTSPVIVNTGAGEQILTSQEERVWALDAHGVVLATGESVDPAAGGVFLSHPARCPATGHLLVGNDEGELYAFDPHLEVVWHWPGNWSGATFDYSVWGTPAVDGNKVYVSRDEDAGFLLYGFLDLSDCGLAVTSILPGDPDEDDEVSAPPVVDREGNVVVATYYGYLCKYSPRLERLVWLQFVGDDYEFTGVVVGSDGSIYGASAYGLFAYSSEGERQWWLDADRPTVPVVGDSLLFFGDGEGNVWAVHQGDGEVEWMTEVGGLTEFVSSPLLTQNGLVYLFDDTEGVLYCLSQADGSIFWSNDLTDTPSYGWADDELAPSMTATSAGNVIVGTRSGIYCVKGYPDGRLADTPWPKWQHDLYNTGCARTRIR